LGHEHCQIKKKANNFELYFETDELEKTIQQLNENKIELIHEIVEQPWGQRVTRFYDPDNHIIEVGESMDSVVLRYHATGMNMEDIKRKTSMPQKFIEKIVLNI
jgi:uncharacterized glyoxalase superfamily protein PhnB